MLNAIWFARRHASALASDPLIESLRDIGPQILWYNSYAASDRLGENMFHPTNLNERRLCQTRYWVAAWLAMNIN